MNKFFQKNCSTLRVRKDGEMGEILFFEKNIRLKRSKKPEVIFPDFARGPCI